MIWQLMKRDPFWKGWTALLAILFAALAVASPLLPATLSYASREAVRTAAEVELGVYAFLLAGVIFLVQLQRTPYEAALPISGRDLWLSRLLPLLILIWLPVLVAIAFGMPPAPPLDAAAIYTVLVVGGTYLGMRELAASQRLSAAAIGIAFLGMIVLPSVAMHAKSVPWLAWPPSAIVLTIYGLVSAILFWRGWNSVPKSFQIAALELGRTHRREAHEQSDFPSVPAAPMFRSIYGVLMLFIVLFLVGSIFFMKSLWAADPVAGLTPVLLIRGRCRWLLALPVSARKLFGWTAIPPAATVVAARLSTILIDTGHPLSPRGRLVLVAAELAVLYALIFLSELPAWRRLSKLRAAKFGGWILWTPFVIGAFAPIFVLPNTSAMQRLAEALPGSFWQLAGMLAALVMATYWLAEKAFREQEYRRPLVEATAHRR